MMTRMRTSTGRRHAIADERQRYYNLLCRLREQGFIKKAVKKKWRITAAGNTWIETLRARIVNAMPAAASYITEQSPEWKIVIFDIPESERRKRRWLRAVLTRLGLKRLQKSVWIGKTKLPEEFIEDLRRFRLLPFVEIFAITKAGSLRQL